MEIQNNINNIDNMLALSMSKLRLQLILEIITHTLRIAIKS